jgi:Ubiquitin-conjugating enzyme
MPCQPVSHVQLVMGEDFPAAPPKGYFLTKTFHPNISETGDICVNVLKKDWNADLGIRHVLLVGTRYGSTRTLLACQLQVYQHVPADVMMCAPC